MWFKNIALFQFQEPFATEASALAELLQAGAFRPCLSQEMQSAGWVAPLGRKSGALVHAVAGCYLCCLQVEEKVLPAAVIKELLGERIAEIEEREARGVRRRERERLREQLLGELLPRAFSRSRRTLVYIDRERGWLVIDSASAKGIEEITGGLRQALGSLPVAPPEVASAPAAVMSDWLARGAPAEVELEDECELRDGDGVVRCRGQALTSDEIRGHLLAGKQVTRLGFVWDGRLSLMLGDDLLIRRLRFLDLIQEQLDAIDSDDDERQLLDAQFALMSGELRRFVPRLLGWFA